MSVEFEEDEEERKIQEDSEKIRKYDKTHLCTNLFLNVDRSNIVESVLDAISGLPSNKLRLPLKVKYTNEGDEGVDAGGIKRDCFTLLMEDLCKPQRLLFTQVEKSNCLTINRNACVNSEYLNLFYTFGQLLAVCLMNDIFVPTYLCPYFFKDLVRIRLYMKDLEMYDPELYHSTCTLLEMEDSSVLDAYFETNIDIAPGIKAALPLCVNGQDRLVTNENRKEYIALLVDYKLKFRTRKQINQIRLGFNSVIPLRWLKSFSASELPILFCGEESLDVDQWEKYTELQGYKKTDNIVKWFWEIVRDMKPSERTVLFQFATGASRLPPGGFEALKKFSGYDFTISKANNVSNLPVAHTCFNIIEIPPYRTKIQLKKKLSISLQFGSEPFGLV